MTIHNSPTTSSQSQPSSLRLYYLDWLRVLIILAIFVHHSTRMFDTDDWHIKSTVLYPFMDILKEFATTWGMPAILMISGSSVFFALSKTRPGKYLLGIVTRLLVPLLVGIFTHVALIRYLELLNKGQFQGSFFAFYPHYFDGMYGFGGNFAWMGFHLWYLEILFVYSLLFLPLFLWLKKTRPGRLVLHGLGSFLAFPGALFLLALPVAYLLVVLDPATWGLKDLGGWSVLIYPIFFLAGFVFVSHDRLQAQIRRQRWISLAAGAFLWPASYFWAPSLNISTHSLITSLLLSLSAWGWLLAAYGFAAQNLSFTNPFLKYANTAVLPFYILHQTIIVIIGYFVAPTSLPGLVKFLLILIPSFLTIVGLYEYIIRRNNLLRFLFGMKQLSRKPVLQAAETTAGKEAIAMENA